MAIRFSSRYAIAASLLSVSLLTASAAFADQFQFIYTGGFSSDDSLTLAGDPTTYFDAGTPFTITALFDDASPNLAPAFFPGFVAYSPIYARMTVNGQTFNFVTYDQDPYAGVTVSIFDQSTPFGPGHYAAGILQAPVEDGAGIIGDWLSASPNFSASHLVSTVFTEYVGAGFSPGPPDGETVRPIPMYDTNGQTYFLIPAFRDEEYSEGAPLQTAQLVAVPEPGIVAFGLTSAAMTGLLVVRRRRK